MKRRLAPLATLFFILLVFVHQSYAVTVTQATPTVYKLTMQKFEVSSDKGTTWTTLQQKNQEIDIASVNAGQVAAGYVSDAAMAVGVYNRIRVTISATFTMQGFAYYTSQNTTYFTTASGISSIAGNVSNTSLMTNYGQLSITIPGQTQLSSTFDLSSTPIVIAQGKTQKVTVSFDVTSTLTLDDTSGLVNFYPSEPTVTQTIS